MTLEWIRERLAAAGEAEAVIEGGRASSYATLLTAIDTLRARFADWGVGRGDTVAFAGDYSIRGIARFVATVLEGGVVVPIAATVEAEVEAALRATTADWFWPADAPLHAPPTRWSRDRSDHPHLLELRRRGHAGTIVLTSGSEGAPKVILHDAHSLLDKFRTPPRRAYRSLVFLLPDHMGGINTLFGMLTSGSTIIIPAGRDAGSVCRAVAEHRATLLPVTPSFLNLLIASEAWRNIDLSSLEVISYGTEVMPDPTLRAAVRIFPNVRFVQLYGSSELGILRTQAIANDSPYVRFKGEGVEFKVQEGRLAVRGARSMIGYLSGQSTGYGDDGWYETGDLVDERDGALRFMGRASELINVGGNKVYPAEVEAALLEIDGVDDCAVFGEAHALTGQIVVARVKITSDEDRTSFKRRMRNALKDRLEPYKLPVRVILADTVISTRLKRIRRSVS